MVHTRKGLVFSLTALFLFLSVIASATNINVRIDDETKTVNQEIPARIDRITYSTISRDVARAYKTGASSTISNTTIKEEMQWNISMAISDYETFINNFYPKNVNATKHDEAVYIGNHTRISYGANKTYFNITSNKTINYYYLAINASGVANSSMSDWAWTSNGTYINLTILDLNGTLAIINGTRSGYINKSRLNSFNITYANGKTLTIKASDYLLVNSTLQASTSTTIDVTGSVYAGYTVKITNNVIEMKKEYKTIIQ